jgi:membrane-associated phospholipid phosphatase
VCANEAATGPDRNQIFTPAAFGSQYLSATLEWKTSLGEGRALKIWRPNLDQSACALLGGFALLTVACEPAGWAALDRAAREFTRGLAGTPIAFAASLVYVLGTPIMSFLLTLTLGSAVLLARGLRASLLALGFVGLLTLFEGALRIRVGGVPWSHLGALVTDRHVWHFVDSTFPSGHTARLVLLAGMVTASMPRAFRLGSGLAAVCLGCLMAIQRVQVGQHTGTDVVGGLLLGAGLATAYAASLAAELRLPPS